MQTKKKDPQVAVTPRAGTGHARKKDELPWRDRPLTQLALASQVSGLSQTSIRREAARGNLVLKRLAGRVLVETSSLVKLIESAEPWTASERGKAARQKRSEIARANWLTGGAS
ncbi:hypothetical protein [Methylocapsa acidiphila]|uniref:hypothetical protein n=1 Tax=Methylocapsa acidiphila TaxID=133552 RepID=UPI0004793230|nr:hypothetical protein [Methylocapsa acidiphila]